MDKKTIIVFGATGKVGCYTALHLKECGYDVIAAGKRSSDNGFFADFGITYHSVDIMDMESYKVLPQKDVYGIVHMAAILPATMEGYNPRTYVESNIYGTLNVLDYAVAVASGIIAGLLDSFLVGETDIDVDKIQKELEEKYSGNFPNIWQLRR